uniref:Putative secreted protein n=1 Tax=Ixodes ricinus TaxID=34613 RepID=A0A147BK29_IXORI
MKHIIIPEVVVSMAGLFDCLLRLYAKRSCGMDEIPNIYLRRYAEWYSKFFMSFTHVVLMLESYPMSGGMPGLFPFKNLALFYLFNKYCRPHVVQAGWAGYKLKNSYKKQK